MLLKTIEFVPSDISLTLDSLQTQLNEGKYDDILVKFNFFTITEKGLTLVKQDKTIVTNATVDLSSYALKSDIPSLSGYATESFVATEIGKIVIPDVSSFITETDVNDILTNKSYASTDDLHLHDNKAILDTITSEKIAAWDSATAGSNVDLTGYVKTSDLDKYALKTDIPSLSGYATESFVTTEIAKINIPDVSNFISEIPSEYITEDELNQKGYLTEHQSLADYAKTSDIPDISNLVSTATLNNMFTIDASGNLIVSINGATQTYAPITTE